MEKQHFVFIDSNQMHRKITYVGRQGSLSLANGMTSPNSDFSVLFYSVFRSKSLSPI
jgi:hypothetical protein